MADTAGIQELARFPRICSSVIWDSIDQRSATQATGLLGSGCGCALDQRIEEIDCAMAAVLIKCGSSDHRFEMPVQASGF